PSGQRPAERAPIGGRGPIVRAGRLHALQALAEAGHRIGVLSQATKALAEDGLRIAGEEVVARLAPSRGPHEGPPHGLAFTAPPGSMIRPGQSLSRPESIPMVRPSLSPQDNDNPLPQRDGAFAQTGGLIDLGEAAHPPQRLGVALAQYG